MFIDAHEVPEETNLDTDVCIIGAGAAGITLAREFRSAPFRTCLLESGGFEYDTTTQDLYKGQNIGRTYYDLDVCRLRYFGGTTNHWGGDCRPLNLIDFEEQPWVPYSGWPFGIEELLPYYRRAQEVCQLGPYGYDAGYLQEHIANGLLPLDKARMVTEVMQFSPPTHFGDVYRPEIKAAVNVTAYLNANVTNIETRDTTKAVTRLRIATLSGRRFWITAKIYILAAGGIENARLLLVSNKTEAAGLGNEHDLVGRFFMDHPEYIVGLLLPVNPGDEKWATYCQDYYGRKRWQMLGTLSPRKSILEHDQILHCSIGLIYGGTPSEGWNALHEILHGNYLGAKQFASDLWRVLTDIEDVVRVGYAKLTHGFLPQTTFPIYCWGQTAPNPNSRVTLGDKRDMLDLPRLKLDLQLSELGRKSIKRTLEIFAQTLGETGLGRAQMTFDDWPSDFHYGNHHIGTTRMSADAKRGVVNADCRLHGIGNLYVAGSSVFPTSGSANPTLTIVALALRLADHIKRSMGA